jgi:hypothetical protein
VRLKTTEHAEQVKVVDWAKWQAKINPELELLFAVPNGGKRHIKVAQKLKAEGTRAGVPDLILPVARLPFHGLFIEMKVAGNKPSDAQIWWLSNLNQQGYLATVCYGADQAIEVLINYIRHGQTNKEVTKIRGSKKLQV